IAAGLLPDRATFKARIKAAVTDADTEKSTLQYLDEYIDHLKAKGKSYHTIRNIEQLKNLLTEMQGKGISLAFDHIDLRFETAMLKAMAGKNHNTKANYVKRLKMF